MKRRTLVCLVCLCLIIGSSGSSLAGPTTAAGTREGADLAQTLSLSLRVGWNLISFPTLTDPVPISTLLLPIASSYDLAFVFDASDAADHWKQHLPDAPAWANELTPVDRTMGLWIKATAPVTLTVSGSAPAMTDIQLTSGWNLVGYPCLAAQPITDGLAGIGGSCDLVFAHDGSAGGDAWLTYIASAPPLTNSLTQMAPTIGYWLHVTQDCLWRVTCPEPAPGDTLLQPSSLAYRGAFSYPAGDDWAYSGRALAYYPAGDPASSDGYPGSLYATGLAPDGLVGEMSIPAPVICDRFEDLPRATVRQGLADITGGRKDNCAYNNDCMYREVAGLGYLRNVDKIAWNLADWYNVAGYDQDSLGWSNLDLTGAQGVWHIGQRPSADNVFHNAKACNYLLVAPQAYADEHLGGRWLIAGNHREAGAFGGSQGPSLYALAPWQDGSPPASGQNLDALALLYYPEIYACAADGVPTGCHFPEYRARDSWEGAVWIASDAGTAILVLGTKGMGPNCYDPPPPDPMCTDPCSNSKGYHAYPYEAQILFYSPDELSQVLTGAKDPWQVLPYQVHSPSDVLFGGECSRLGAAAYDSDNDIIYMAEQMAGPWGETVVHVWQIVD